MIIITSACGGSGGGGSSGDASKSDASSSPAAGGPNKADFTAKPIQLELDPCALVTKTEAEALIGPVGDANGDTFTPPKCVYVSSKGTGGQLVVSLTEPDFCALLFLALDKNIFGGVQKRLDDIGDGGMLVKGNGNVQFVVNGGCIEVAGAVDRETKVDDQTMLRVAKSAAERVS